MLNNYGFLEYKLDKLNVTLIRYNFKVKCCWRLPSILEKKKILNYLEKGFWEANLVLNNVDNLNKEF